jgi:predicted nucleotidyltransferase
VDILITVPENRRLKLADLLQMQAELEDILGREVDLGTRRSVEEDENYLRRQAILESAQVIYAE